MVDDRRGRGTVYIEMDAALYKSLKICAAREERTLAEQIRYFVRHGLERYEISTRVYRREEKP